MRWYAASWRASSPCARRGCAEACVVQVDETRGAAGRGAHSDGGAYVRHGGRAVLSRQAGCVLVRDLGGALLEGGVDEAPVGVGAELRVEAAADEALNGHLHRAHVHGAREVEELVEEVAVAVLF